GPALEAKGRATVDLETKQMQLALVRSVIHLGALERLRGLAIPVTGQIQASGPLTWKPTGPEGALRITLAEMHGEVGGIQLDQSAVGDIDGTLRLHSNGMDLEVATPSSDAWNLEVHVGFEPTMPLVGTLRFDALELAPEFDGRRPLSVRLGG